MAEEGDESNIDVMVAMKTEELNEVCMSWGSNNNNINYKYTDT